MANEHLTYVGNNTEFKNLIKIANSAIEYFFDQSKSKDFAIQFFEITLETLLKVKEDAPDEWLKEMLYDADSDTHALKNFRELVTCLESINGVASSGVMGKLSTHGERLKSTLERLIESCKQTILAEENILNKTPENSVLKQLEYGGSIVMKAGLYIAATGGTSYLAGATLQTLSTVAFYNTSAISLKVIASGVELGAKLRSFGEAAALGGSGVSTFGASAKFAANAFISGSEENTSSQYTEKKFV